MRRNFKVEYLCIIDKCGHSISLKILIKLMIQFIVLYLEEYKVLFLKKIKIGKILV